MSISSSSSGEGIESTTAERTALMVMSPQAAVDFKEGPLLQERMEEAARLERMTLTLTSGERAAVLVEYFKARAAHDNRLVEEAKARAAHENRLAEDAKARAKEAEERMAKYNLGKNCVSIQCSPHTHLCLHSPLPPRIRFCLVCVSFLSPS